jgi:GntR family transcriptional regulator, transcriptional repressor for pyruvate dehydrogenase complex
MSSANSTAAPAPTMRRVKVKVVDEIIESLRQEIVTRRMVKGDRMPTERELADRYGVSQPTVREAIRALEILGLVDVHHGSGIYISGHTDYALASALQTLLQLEGVGILDVLAVRQILGREAVEMAADRADAEGLAAIRSALDQLEDVHTAPDVEEIIRRVIEFQRAVSACARNPLLHSLEVFLLTLLIEIQVGAFQDKGVRFWRTRVAEFQDDRKAIYAAIANRDSKAARKAMLRYLDDQRARFVDDKALSKLNLSDPALIAAVAGIVRQYRPVQRIGARRSSGSRASLKRNADRRGLD